MVFNFSEYQLIRLFKSCKYKKVDIIHKEPNEECFEILKSTIVEDKELKKYRIDKDTLLHELPEAVVNEFLDFLGTEERHRNLMLHMIKTGSLVMNCWEDDEEFKNVRKNGSKHIRRKGESYSKQKPFDPLDTPFDNTLPF
jgi:hypothetical protein